VTVRVVGGVVVERGPMPSDPWSILAVLPRRSVISRGAAGTGGGEQVLASNVDKVWIVHGLDMPFNSRRLERYLAVVWDTGANPEIILTKEDLAEDLDSWLLDREADGTLNRLRSKYFGTQKPSRSATPLRALLTAIDERLSLMPMVGAAKRSAGLPLEVPEREGIVLDAAIESAMLAAQRADLAPAIEVDGGELSDRRLGVLFRVEGQGGMMLREAASIRVARVLFLEVSRVRQQDAARIGVGAEGDAEQIHDLALVPLRPSEQ